MTMQTQKNRAAAAQDQVLVNINITGAGLPGFVKLYTGAIPANITVGATGTLLATLTLVDGTVPAFSNTDPVTLVATGYTSAGVFASDPSAGNTGTIGYFRILDPSLQEILQGSCGLVGSGEDIEWNTLSVVAGNVVVLTAFTSTISGLF